MPVVTFRLAPTIHQRLHEVCAERETTVSAVLQRAVEAFIDRVDDNAAEIRHVRSDARGGGAGFAKVTPDGRIERIAPESIYVDARTGEPLKPRGPMQKGGKK
jgi:predicted transcriptional regulator